jgi:hypothetical protein
MAERTSTEIREAHEEDLVRRQSEYLHGVTQAALAGESAHKALADRIHELAVQQVAKAKGKHPRHEFTPATFDLGHSSAVKWRGMSTIRFQAVSTGSANAVSDSDEVKVDVPFTVGARCALSAVAFFRAWIWSPTAIVYFVPMVLALGAAGVCLAKIAA